MTETPCCAYHDGRTEGMLVACQPTPAAAVPEAQDGRAAERVYQAAYDAWQAATNATRVTFAEGDALRKVADAVQAASAAVREGERERLATAWKEGHTAGRADEHTYADWWEESLAAEDHGEEPPRRPDLTPNPYAPPLAAPEGTGDGPPPLLDDLIR